MFPGDEQNVEFSDAVMGANHSSTLVCSSHVHQQTLLLLPVGALNVVNGTRRRLGATAQIQK